MKTDAVLFQKQVGPTCLAMYPDQVHLEWRQLHLEVLWI